MYCFRRRVNVVFKVLEGVAFLESTSRDPQEYKATFTPNERLSLSRLEAIRKLAAAEHKIVRLRANLEAIRKKKELLSLLISRNKRAEESAVYRFKLPPGSHFSLPLTSGSLLTLENFLDPRGFQQESRIGINFWILPFSRTTSFALENEGTRFAVRSSQAIRFHDYAYALAHLLVGR